jgi:hypothetical protein
MIRECVVVAPFPLIVGLSWAGEVACDALPADSFSRMECERNQRRLGEQKQDRGTVLEGPAQTGRESGRSPVLAQDPFPPLRYAGEEPLMTICMMSGAIIRADKTWIEGDRLFYWSRAVQGSVPLIPLGFIPSGLPRSEDGRDS